MFDYQYISVNRIGQVACVNLNRPQRANCLNGPMWKELKMVFDAVSDLPDVRAVVLGGEGRIFCAGIDLEYLATIGQKIKQMNDGRRQEYLQQFIVDLQGAVNAIENCHKPVLAAIQGACIGGGLDIAAACDWRYATEGARFSIKEVDLAIVADLGSLQRLPGIVGQGIARELAFTGREFKGREAMEMGLVNGLFSTKPKLVEGTLAQAEALTQKSPLTLRGIKATMNYSRDHSVDEGLAHVAARNAAMLLSRDLEEAVTAFMEKRQPKFDD